MKTVPIAAVLVLSLAGFAAGQPPAGPFYRLVDTDVVPWAAPKRGLVTHPAVQQELKLTEAQTLGVAAEMSHMAQKFRDASRVKADRQATIAARDAVFAETLAALQKLIGPELWERLGQIQLQIQGPLAFAPPANAVLAGEGPGLAESLALTDDQVAKVRAIVQDGMKAVGTAARFPVVVDPKAGPPTAESVRALVAGEPFRESKRKAREAVQSAREATLARIEEVLTEPQRDAYKARLGAPFDLAALERRVNAEESDAGFIAGQLNVGGVGGQQPDPAFDAKVARPSYAASHPRVVIDEAHRNFHTGGGRYKPFADLLANDGYQVLSNRDVFSKDVLARGDVLVIANARGGDGTVDTRPADPAFTAAECDAVRDWVEAGGALLLITDHAPFGSAAEGLAKTFGVGMGKGATSDAAHSAGDEMSLVFSRGNGLLVDHPITTGRDESERVDKVQTFTGQSLQGPAGSVALLKLADTATDNGPDGKPVPAAGRSQAVALAFGKGRVVVLGEAACLTAQVVGRERFGMNVPGLDNRKLALNILHWLSGLL